MRALITITSGLSVGIFARSLFFGTWWPILFILLLTALVGTFGFVKPRRVYSLGVLFFFFIALGMVRYSVADTPLPQAFAADLRHRVAYDGVVVGDPDIREKNQRIPLVVERAGERVGVLAVMPLYAHVAVGDRVHVTGTLVAPQAFATDNGRVFRYDAFLQARGQRFLIEYGSIRVTTPAPWRSLPAALARIKHAFLEGLDHALSSPQAELAGGIVIGGKTGLPKSLQEAFTRSGLVQIIVLSGYNVMIVAEWVMILLSFLPLTRWVRYAAGGTGLLLFVGIAGFSTTAIRATIMAIIALYARATGKSYAASRALLVTVCGMLMWNPLMLCFDPGFALSVAATAGVIWLSPSIENRLRIRWAFLNNAIATTIAAQVSVLPLLLYMSGLLSFVALPANILVNPIVPLAMLSAAVAGIGGMLLGSLAPALLHFIALPAHLLTTIIITIAEKSAALPYAALTLHQFPFWLVLLSYTALIALAKRLSTTDQLRLAKKASI